MKKLLYGYRLNIVSIVVFFLIAISAFYLTRGRLTLDFEDLTATVTDYLSVEEENRIRQINQDFQRYKSMMLEVEKFHASDAWLQEAFDKSLFVLKQPYLKHFIIRNGKVFSNGPDIPGFEELSKSDWYQKAAKTTGKTVITPPYRLTPDAQPVITLAQMLPDTDIVIGINIYLYQNQNFLDLLEVPQGSKYYYFDADGLLLQSISADDSMPVKDTACAEKLFDYIKSLNGDGKGGFIYSEDEQKSGVFYYISPKNRISFVTVPYKKIYPTPWIFIAALIILGIYSVFTFFSYLHEKRLNAESQFKEETIEFLGNMYFFIVRINFMSNTYKSIKISSELKEKTQNITEYDKLIKHLSLQIEPKASEDFRKIFLLKNVKELFEKYGEEYSGDFRGKFFGEYRWLNARLIVNKSFKNHEAILCFRDIENEKQHQINQVRLLQESLDHAQKSEQAKNEFFAKMSHDMRTPLNAVMGYITLAKQLAETPAEFIGYLEKISASSEHLLELIDYILNVSRMENDRQEQENSEIDLTECIKNCLEPFYALAKTQSKNFSVSMDITNTYVLSSCFKIKQILNNIITNSFKYSPKGADISVTIRQLSQGKLCKYEMVVADTGYGISKKFLDEIFMPYSRESRFSFSNVQGTGLGMNIVKNIVSGMNGELGIDSEEGKGTTVTVVLVMETVEIKSVKKDQSTETEINLSGKRILLVDDNNINLEILEKLLTIKGVVCEKAFNGLEALFKFEQSAENYYDCILMDLQMPVMGGLEATQKIRLLEREDAARIPIIALTANAFAEDVIATVNAGMNSHIAKPINSKLLYQTILNLTQKAE